MVRDKVCKRFYVQVALRSTGHDFKLFAIKYKFNKRIFVVCSLLNYL